METEKRQKDNTVNQYSWREGEKKGLKKPETCYFTFIIKVNSDAAG